VSGEGLPSSFRLAAGDPPMTRLETSYDAMQGHCAIFDGETTCARARDHYAPGTSWHRFYDPSGSGRWIDKDANGVEQDRGGGWDPPPPPRRPDIEVRPHVCTACGEGLLRFKVLDADWSDPVEDLVLKVEPLGVAGTGHLCEPKRQPVFVFDSKEAAARWLATASDSPRYGPEGYGWEGLIGEPENVQHAAQHAARRLSGDAEGLARVHAARTILEAP
jgi:hypothetical protein